MSGIVNALRERVTIQRQVMSNDEYGGKEISWEALATVFAGVEPIRQSSRERSLGEQLHAIAGYRVHIRARNDVDASMRVHWKNRVLHIHSLHEQEGMLELLTYEEQV